MLFYGETFLVTLVLSALFAMGGVGSAIALIPLLHFLGVSFDLAKAIGLFVNTVTTSTASLINYRRNMLDARFCLPFLITSLLFAPVGAYSINWVDLFYVKLLFSGFLLFFALFIISGKRRCKSLNLTPGPVTMAVLGVFAGFIAGLLGIGGSIFVIPALLLLNLDAKKIAITTSFTIPFGTLPAFLSYCFLLDIDWVLVATTTIAAIIGGYIGTNTMHFKIDSHKMQYLLAGLMFVIGLNMAWPLLYGA